MYYIKCIMFLMIPCMRNRLGCIATLVRHIVL